MSSATLAARPAPLIRLGAVAGALGGAMRIVSSFVPHQAGQAWLEAFYGAIDLCLLFGLLAIYLASSDALGTVGLVLFAAALAGLASIVGPDAQAFGVDFYRLGALVFVIALAGLSVELLQKKALMASAAMWIAALACTLAAAFVQTPVVFIAAGVLLGAGYVLAGLEVLRLRAGPGLHRGG